jgi:ferredoxin
VTNVTVDSGGSDENSPTKHLEFVFMPADRDKVGFNSVGRYGPTHQFEKREPPMGMKVWIDQDLCTGDGLCEEIAPSVFTLLDDGLAYVKEGAKVFSDPGGPEGLANVVEKDHDGTIESAEECPGECIFIEME